MKTKNLSDLDHVLVHSFWKIFKEEDLTFTDEEIIQKISDKTNLSSKEIIHLYNISKDSFNLKEPKSTRINPIQLDREKGLLKDYNGKTQAIMTIINGLLHLEEEVEYNILDLPILHKNPERWDIVKNYMIELMQTKNVKNIDKEEQVDSHYAETIKLFMPIIEFTGEKTFRISNSPFFRTLDQGQIVLLYISKNSKESLKNPIGLPSRLINHPEFYNDLGVFYKTEDNKEFVLTNQGIKMILEINEIRYNVANGLMSIDEAAFRIKKMAQVGPDKFDYYYPLQYTNKGNFKPYEPALISPITTFNKDFQDIVKILRCPQTGKTLSYNEELDVLEVNGESIIYPIRNGIIEFLPDTPEVEYLQKIKLITETEEDQAKTYLVLEKIFGLKPRAQDYIDDLFEYIPSDFEGIFLDVPAGRGTITYKKYRELKKSIIVVVEYSVSDLLYAQKLFSKYNIHNIIYIHGDVGNIPISDESVDLFLTMNGFQVFPNRGKALDEMWRVLKEDGIFTGCSFVSGARPQADRYVKLVRPLGFNSVQLSENELIEFLGTKFNISGSGRFETIVYFKGTKKEIELISPIAGVPPIDITEIPSKMGMPMGDMTTLKEDNYLRDFVNIILEYLGDKDIILEPVSEDWTFVNMLRDICAKYLPDGDWEMFYNDFMSVIALNPYILKDEAEQRKIWASCPLEAKDLWEAFVENLKRDINEISILPITADIIYNLERLESVNDFITIGNFEVVLTKEYDTIEKLKEGLLVNYFEGKTEEFKKWKSELKRLNKIFRGIHEIYQNKDMFRDICNDFIRSTLNALNRLYEFDDFSEILHINRIFFPYYEEYLVDSYYEANEMSINLQIIQEINESLPDISITNSKRTDLLYLSPESINRYSIQELITAGMFNWQITLEQFNKLRVSPKTISLHKYMREKGYTAEILTRYYMLSLSHELFHQKTITWYRNLSPHFYEIKGLLEVLTELRKFTFFISNLDEFNNLRDFYLDDELHKLFKKDICVISPYYFKGLIYILALIGLGSVKENLELINIFCEDRDPLIRIGALHNILTNIYNKDDKNVIKHDVDYIQIFKSLKESFLLEREYRTRDLHPSLGKIYTEQIEDLEDLYMIDLVYSGIVIFNIVLDKFTNNDYQDQIFKLINKNIQNYKYLNDYFNYGEETLPVGVTEGMHLKNERDKGLEQKEKNYSFEKGPILTPDLYLTSEDFEEVLKDTPEKMRKEGYSEEEINAYIENLKHDFKDFL